MYRCILSKSKFCDQNVAAAARVSPAVDKAGRSSKALATSGRPIRRAGLMLRTSANKRVAILPPSPPRMSTTSSGRRWSDKARTTSGSEAATWRRKASGTGTTAHFGTSRSGKPASRTTTMGSSIACSTGLTTSMMLTAGTTMSARMKNHLSAAR